mmetsp:Transcript_58403/g.167607  ORF Transcript_58403/g.167607 Transcript_58403/m.167607 type:complete len:238 (+) Transcript_58403:227-940(+)
MLARPGGASGPPRQERVASSSGRSARRGPLRRPSTSRSKLRLARSKGSGGRPGLSRKRHVAKDSRPKFRAGVGGTGLSPNRLGSNRRAWRGWKWKRLAGRGERRQRSVRSFRAEAAQSKPKRRRTLTTSWTLCTCAHDRPGLRLPSPAPWGVPARACEAPHHQLPAVGQHPSCRKSLWSLGRGALIRSASTVQPRKRSLLLLLNRRVSAALEEASPSRQFRRSFTWRSRLRSPRKSS